MKKGRHRRFEEARALKRGSSFDYSSDTDTKTEPCPECGGENTDHATWCMYTADDDSVEVVDDK